MPIGSFYPQLSFLWRQPQPGSLLESFHLLALVSVAPTLTTKF